jgi:hypothetical protein
MKIESLSSQQAALFIGATHRVNFTFADLSGTAATSLTSTIASLTAKTAVRFAGYHLVTPFDGTSTTSLTLALGIDRASGTDDADGFLAATELHNDATEVVIGPVPLLDVDNSTVDNTYGAEENAVITSLRTKLNTLMKLASQAYSDASEIEAVWTSTSANLTDLTSGEIDLYFAIVDLTKR